MSGFWDEDGVALAASVCDGKGLCQAGATTECGRAGCNGNVCASVTVTGGPGDDMPKDAGTTSGGCSLATRPSTRPSTGGALLLFLGMTLLTLRRRLRTTRP